VGNVVAFDRDGKRLVGYWLGRAHWGKGIASRALGEFPRIETRRPLHARVLKTNRASIRVLEKNGFERLREVTGAQGDEAGEEFEFELKGPQLLVK
jgi:RimJ/RimL family protein N-acetyltransferase